MTNISFIDDFKKFLIGKILYFDYGDGTQNNALFVFKINENNIFFWLQLSNKLKQGQCTLNNIQDMLIYKGWKIIQ